jgi:hypothetical protein
MTLPSHPDDAAIDALVRAHLARQEEAVDPHRLYRRLGLTPAPKRRTRRHVGWLALVGAAAALLLAAWGLAPMPARADAAGLVRSARDALATPLDRRYRVEMVIPAEVRERFPFTDNRQMTLWTRGDRFRVEVQGQLPDGRAWKWTWGQDETRRVWAAGPRFGLEYEPYELPEPLARAAELCSLNFDTLLADVLRGFEMHLEEQDGLMVVRATRRPGFVRAPVRTVTLMFDPDSRNLHQVVVERLVRPGDPRTLATTFTFERFDEQADEQYHLATHLPEGGRIYGPDEPFWRSIQVMRIPWLARHFAPPARQPRFERP